LIIPPAFLEKLRKLYRGRSTIAQRPYAACDLRLDDPSSSVLRVLCSTYTKEERCDMERFFAAVIVCLLAASSSAIAREQPETVTLSCAASLNGEQVPLETLDIDYVHRTVNGAPATFPSSTMTASFKNRSGVIVQYELNRRTGTGFTIVPSSQNDQPLAVTCVKVGPPLF
jgi:hypothetical protein